MRCAWEAYLNILPLWMRQQTDKQGRDSLQEIRLRLDRPPELVKANGSIWMDRAIKREDLDFVVNAASRYSPWTSETIRLGYISAPGGHRIGLCGNAVGEGGSLGVREVTSLCVRVARDFPGISGNLATLKGAIVVLGAPGSGKTTLLRDIIRQKSEKYEETVSVVDERGEIFPQWQNSFCFYPGKRTDVLYGCAKATAIPILLRTMTPKIIAVDEITAEEDCKALLQASRCGATLIATAHAEDIKTFRTREIYRKLLENNVFCHYIWMHRDQSWTQERMDI